MLLRGGVSRVPRGGLGHQHDRGLAVYLLALSIKEMMLFTCPLVAYLLLVCYLYVAYVLPIRCLQVALCCVECVLAA